MKTTTGSSRKKGLGVQQTLDTAIKFYQEGRQADAVNTCWSILESEPSNATAYHLLGVIAYQNQQSQEAMDLISKSLDCEFENAEIQNFLGIIFVNTGRKLEAEKCFRQAIRIEPRFPEAHNNLGNVLKDLGQLDDAISSYQNALAERPNYEVAYNNLGCSYKDLAQFENSISNFEKAIAINPDYDEAHGNLGDLLCKLGQFAEAAEHYTAAVSINPDSVQMHTSLGLALRDIGRLDEAVERLQHAIAIEPRNFFAHSGLGSVFKIMGQLDRAISSHRKAIAIKPDFVEAHNNLGAALLAKGKLNDAIISFQHAISIKPGFIRAHSNLGYALLLIGKSDEAAGSLRQALSIKPDSADTHSNLLRCLQFGLDVDPFGLKEEHILWAQAHSGPIGKLDKKFDLDLDLKRPLNVGLVSPDFGRHPVAFLTIKLLECSNHPDLRFYCYSDRRNSDEYTERFRKTCHQWTDSTDLVDKDLAKSIQNDQIDILIDLAGHTAGNRLTMFADKPSPIQVSWAGYVGTTGLAAMDYVIADKFHCLEGEEKHYVEKVLRLRDGYVCYDIPVGAPPVGRLPAKKNRYVTFGCFSSPAKINSQTLEIWSQILNLVPSSRLNLNFKWIDNSKNKKRILSKFKEEGIDESRISLEGQPIFLDILERYNAIDIALDTWPYSGGVTTCEALLMGVPVVTFPGRTFAGRHSVSHLNIVGLVETIAKDKDDYIDISVSLAQDLDRLDRIRAELRERMQKSPLCDGPRFADSFRNSMREIWTTYVNSVKN